MGLPYPHFQVNYKVYPGTWGNSGLALARTIERIGAETGGQFVLTPQLPDLRLLARETTLPVTAPRVDPVAPGRGMSRILPEALQAAGADGAIINHAEARDTLDAVEGKVERCREVGLESIVCVDSVKMGRAVARFEPDQFLFERPSTIAGDRPLTESDPEQITTFLDMRDDHAPATAVRIGGGISTPAAVREAFELGVDAVGAASAIATADEPEGLLRAIGAVIAEQ